MEEEGRLEFLEDLNMEPCHQKSSSVQTQSDKVWPGKGHVQVAVRTSQTFVLLLSHLKGNDLFWFLVAGGFSPTCQFLNNHLEA